MRSYNIIISLYKTIIFYTKFYQNMHQNAGNMPQNFLGNTLQFLYKNDNFWNYFKKHLIKIYTNTHQIAPFLKIFLEDLLNPVMNAHLLFFEKKYDTKGPLFPIFKRFSSIHKKNPALVASIVLKKNLLPRYLCAF